jgi:hypothetical protein
LTEIFSFIMSRAARVTEKFSLWLTSISNKRMMANKPEHEECCLLGSNTVDSGRSSPMSWRNVADYQKITAVIASNSKRRSYLWTIIVIRHSKFHIYFIPGKRMEICEKKSALY